MGTACLLLLSRVCTYIVQSSFRFIATFLSCSFLSFLRAVNTFTFHPLFLLHLFFLFAHAAPFPPLTERSFSLFLSLTPSFPLYLYVCLSPLISSKWDRSRIIIFVAHQYHHTIGERKWIQNLNFRRIILTFHPSSCFHSYCSICVSQRKLTPSSFLFCLFDLKYQTLSFISFQCKLRRGRIPYFVVSPNSSSIPLHTWHPPPHPPTLPRSSTYSYIHTYIYTYVSKSKCQSFFSLAPTTTSPCTFRWGAIYGLQAFAQLMHYNSTANTFSLPGTPIFIDDRPRFPWRGIRKYV